MQVNLTELLSYLGIQEDLLGYETDSSQYRDDDKEKTCSAEVRMAGEQREFEVEILTFFDEPEEGAPPVEQILAMIGKPKSGDRWSLSQASVKGEPLNFGGWEEGVCAFYTEIVMNLRQEVFPDIDALIDEHLQGEGGQAGRNKRGGGRKNPKFKPPSNSISMKRGF